MEEEIQELFKTMAEQFIKLVESNNFLLQENLRLMKEIEELKNERNNI